MKVSDFVVDFLKKQKVDHIFEFPGGATTHILDSLFKLQDVLCVTLHHEQAAAFAADAYGRMTGNLGVAMATSGPGATNLITGIASSFFESSPCLFITGQVNTYEFKYEKKIRQLGFQETDIVNIVKPIVKDAILADKVEDIRYILERAVFIAQSGRPGPVLVDIPMNIQRMDIQPESLRSFINSSEHNKLKEEVLSYDSGYEEAVIQEINRAKRPIVLAGHGIIISHAESKLKDFILKTKIPVVTSLMGLGAVSGLKDFSIGMIGTYGNRYANLSLANADLIIGIGTRFDIRQIGNDVSLFARAARIIHVDIDPNEIGNRVKPDLGIFSDAGTFLENMNTSMKELEFKENPDWQNSIKKYRDKFFLENRGEPDKPAPNDYLALLSEFAEEGDIFCVDVGQHQMWAGQSLDFKKGQHFLTSGGLGSMGFSLPAAIGCCMAAPTKRVINITGDGGMQMNIQELQTVVRNNLPIKTIVMNNGCLGMVRQFQDFYFDGRRQSTYKGYSCPDFVSIAKAYGIGAYKVENLEEAKSCYDRALKTEGPVLIEIILSHETDVRPKVIVGRPIEDPHPFLSREELADNMIIEPHKKGSDSKQEFE